MGDDNKIQVKEKAEFFWQEKIHCHIRLIPNGFINGYILSELIKDKYYVVTDDTENKQHDQEVKSKKVFLCDIFDVGEYREVEG